MQQLVNELGRDPEDGDPEHQLTLARRFDELLLAAAGNQVIAALVDTVSVFGWSLRIRAARAMHDDPEVGMSRIAEHRNILTALRARDADRVETLMRQHLTTAINYFLEQAR
jgi:DNA-binding GntR family transcriptional regulator